MVFFGVQFKASESSEAPPVLPVVIMPVSQQEDPGSKRKKSRWN
jgi:hypothetical protein